MKTNIISTPKSKTLLGAILALIISALAIVAVSGCSSALAEPETGSISATVVSEDWTEADMPVIMHLSSEDAGVDFYHAISFDANPAEFTAFPGTYTSVVLPTLTVDGYLLTCADEAEFTLEAGYVQNGTLNLTKPEAKATVEELDAYLAEVTAAAESGDDTVTDEVIAKATELVESAKAAIAAEEQAKAEAEAKAKAEAEAAAAAEAAAQSSNSGYSNSGTQSSGGNSGYTGGSTASSGSGGDRSCKGTTGLPNWTSGRSDNPLGTGRTSGGEDYYD